MQEGDPVENFDKINAELARYNQELSKRPMLVVFTKQDITEVREQTEELRPTFEEQGFNTLTISAVTREGLSELITRIALELDRMRQQDPLDSTDIEG